MLYTGSKKEHVRTALTTHGPCNNEINTSTLLAQMVWIPHAGSTSASGRLPAPKASAESTAQKQCGRLHAEKLKTVTLLPWQHIGQTAVPIAHQIFRSHIVRSGAEGQ